MEGKTEEQRHCEIFIWGVNQMTRQHFRQINQRFNPTNMQFDEHRSTKIAIKAVFGEEFLKTCTLGYDYHLDRSAEKHKKYFNNSDVDLF